MDPGGVNKMSGSGTVSSNVESVSSSKEQKTDVQSPAGLSSKGIEIAKKRLRSFSIQKKTAMTPIVMPKSVPSGNTTVLIGKLSSVKVTPKIEDPEQKKQPKPPKPGTARKSYQETYTDLQKRTLAEIEDMKRKMELVELGIPLGLICPTSTSEKAMPTKAMPPIKSLLDPSKVDEIIREAKKAKMEGREFKFNYQKLLPDYDNPFRRKKEEYEKDRQPDRRKNMSEKDSDRRKSDRYESKRYDYRKDDTKYKERDRERKKEKIKCSVDTTKKLEKSGEKETDVNLNDYLVCDSWSLDNDEKNSISSPKPEERPTTQSLEIKAINPSEQLKTSIIKRKDIIKSCTIDSPPKNTLVKIGKLKPVIDSFKFEIDPNDDAMLDIFDEDSDLEKYAQNTKAKKQSLVYKSPDKNIKDSSMNTSKDLSMDGMNDDTFLESVINEIKQEDVSDDSIQDKGLVEYDMSPTRDDESPKKSGNGSITPELQERFRSQSQKSDRSEGYRSSDSYKTSETNESGYKSVESYRLSEEKELDETMEKMSKSTVDSLETWSFVLKICQPLLFRHDKNKCYKETRTSPKIWYTGNPKQCACVKDRSIVYEELEMCKMNLVDRVYGCDQISDFPFATARNWYKRNGLTSIETNPVPMSNEWEVEDSQQARLGERSATPQRDEMSLDKEYQRFMAAVWPEVAESKSEMSRSTTPVRQLDSRKKKKEQDKEIEEKKNKKIKLSSEGWSQESDVEEESDKSKRIKVEKEKQKRKRRHSSSSMSSSPSDSNDDSKKRKLLRKKALKKTKSKSAKRRRIGRKILKKLKEKENNRKQANESDDDDKKKDKKIKKKKLQKLKKTEQKKRKAKVESSSSSSSTSSSSSESESEIEKKSKKIKSNNKEDSKKVSTKRKRSTSESSQSEDLFDVNILNNIKTERLTDDEKTHKMMEFSSRRQKPREIINVKELQDDFVENIHIKKEIEDPLPQEVIKSDEFDICNEASASIIEEKELAKIKEQLPSQSSQDIQNSRLRGHSPVPTPSMVAPVVPASPVGFLLPAIPVPPPIPSPATSVPVASPAVNGAIALAAVPLPPDDSNLSQCSSQESVCSNKEIPSYEKDESHLRPSSQNSNYSFNDVISASQSTLYPKGMEAECEDKYAYEANYEMYEQLAMAYQSDVASQRASPPGVDTNGSQKIETVVRARCGEIKCDWRVGDDARAPHPASAARPSRWGLKPVEVNIVLTGGGAQFNRQEESQPVYQIQSIANRTDSTSGYDEAYMDMYGASDRLQYGDCFGVDFDNDANNVNTSVNIDVTGDDNSVTVKNEIKTSSLDARINRALKETILGEVAKEVEADDKETPEKGILVTNVTAEPRGSKRVSFADGYKPGQDSDVEEPPVKRRKKPRRYGCAWPCPAAHPDHVPLWDALPPPPPPPGSPPPPAVPPVPTHLLRPPQRRSLLPGLPTPMTKFETNIPLTGFMPPEPPPGLIALQ